MVKKQMLQNGIPDPSTFLASALLQFAQIMAVDIKKKQQKVVQVIQFKMINYHQQQENLNVRLAAKLTGWKIDIKTETQFRELLAQKQKKQKKEESESKEVQEKQKNKILGGLN